MGKASQNEKRSFLKTRWGGFAARLWKGPQKSNNAMPPIAEADESVIQSVVAAPSACHAQKSKESEGFGKDRLARVPEEHAEQEKQKKAIGHIEKLLKQISQLQNEIENGLKTEIRLEQEISNLVAPSERSPHQTPRRKQEANELSVTKRPFRKCRERSQKNAKKVNSHQTNNNKVRKKLCLRCKKIKGESDFHKDRSCKDGLARWCKECKAKTSRKYRKKQVVR
jgi:hypothetical protein